MKKINSYRRRAKTIKWDWAVDARLKPTRSEELLWQSLLQFKYPPFNSKFRFQSVILGWIADFWCPARRLIVEVDGGYHGTPEQSAKDRTRDAAFKGLGITTLRIPAELVENNLPEAVAVITQKIQSLPRWNSWNDGYANGCYRARRAVK